MAEISPTVILKAWCIVDTFYYLIKQCSITLGLKSLKQEFTSSGRCYALPGTVSNVARSINGFEGWGCKAILCQPPFFFYNITNAIDKF